MTSVLHASATPRTVHGDFTACVGGDAPRFWIPRNSCIGVELPGVANADEIRFLDEAECEAVLRHVGAGLRHGELCALRIMDVDWVAGRIPSLGRRGRHAQQRRQAVAMLAVPTAAMADAPDRTITFNDASGVTADNAGAMKQEATTNGDNLIGWGSSALTHNGQFVSGKASGDADWMHQKGSRSDQVQVDLAVTGRGSQK